MRHYDQHGREVRATDLTPVDHAQVPTCPETDEAYAYGKARSDYFLGLVDEHWGAHAVIVAGACVAANRRDRAREAS